MMLHLLESNNNLNDVILENYLKEYMDSNKFKDYLLGLDNNEVYKLHIGKEAHIWLLENVPEYSRYKILLNKKMKYLDVELIEYMDEKKIKIDYKKITQYALEECNVKILKWIKEIDSSIIENFLLNISTYSKRLINVFEYIKNIKSIEKININYCCIEFLEYAMGLNIKITYSDNFIKTIWKDNKIEILNLLNIKLSKKHVEELIETCEWYESGKITLKQYNYMERKKINYKLNESIFKKNNMDMIKTAIILENKTVIGWCNDGTARESGIKYGNIKLLKWLKKENLNWTNVGYKDYYNIDNYIGYQAQNINKALKNGYMHIINFYVENGVKLIYDEESILKSLRNLESVRLLHANKYKIYMRSIGDKRFYEDEEEHINTWLESF
jgi:hypothetical protein